MKGRRRDLLVLVLLALVLGLAFQGSRGLYETTEGRYAEAGREMLETGDWWVPRLDYRPHWTKPPLTYWGIAAGIAVAGPTEFGARLANGLTLPLAALAVAWLGALLWDPRTGLLAGLVYATSLFPVVAASTISTDLILALWEMLGAALYWKAWRLAGDRGEGREALCILAFWMVTGLAFLTKGPPGLLTLLAVLVFHGVARRKVWDVPKLARPAGVLVCLVVGLGWYVDVVLRTPGLLSYFVGDEVVGRIATDQFGRNPEWYKPALVYGLPLVVGLGGWLVHLGSVRRGLRTGGVRSVRPRALATGPVRLFLAIWLLLPLCILTVSRSRLPLYVLPFFAVLPLVVARGLTWAFPGGDLARRVTPTAALMSLALVALKAGSAVPASSKDMSSLYRRVEELGPPVSLQVVAVDRDALYGLQFYLHGRLDRVRTDVPVGSPTSLERYLRARVSGAGGARPGADRWVFLARGSGEEEERVLADTPGIHYRKVHAEEGWRAWLVEPRTSPTVSSSAPP